MLSGGIPAAALLRLGAAYELRGDARVELRFGWSAGHRPRVTGTLAIPIASICQRCLQTYETTVVAGVDVEIGESPADAEDAFDLVLRPDEALQVTDFVEDELLLEAPTFPLHVRGECAAPDGADDETEGDEATRRPFADLQALWQRTKKE